MTDTPRSNAVSPVVFMGSGGPDLTSQEQVNRSIGMCRLHGLHNTEATLRALSAQLLDVSKREAAMMARYDAKLEAAEAQRDALRANLDEAQAALRECMDEIDGYVRQEYPGDHPVHERYRKRDFSANPARVYFEARKVTP